MAVSTETRQVVGGYSKLLTGCAIAAVIGLLVLFLQCMLLTQTGVVWDEPPGISRQHAMHNWLLKWFGYSDHRAESYSLRGQIRECDCRSCTGALHVQGSGFSEEAIKQGWPFARKPLMNIHRFMRFLVMSDGVLLTLCGLHCLHTDLQRPCCFP